MTAFLHVQSKIFIFSKKGIQRTNLLHLSYSKVASKVRRHLLTSLKVNDLTKHAPCDDIGNVTLTAQGALQASSLIKIQTPLYPTWTLVMDCYIQLVASTV